MKKIISIISIISIILAICLMVSCGNVNETVTEATNTTCAACSNLSFEAPDNLEYSVFANEIYVDGNVYDVQRLVGDAISAYDIAKSYEDDVERGGYGDVYKNVRVYTDRYYIGYWASEDFLDGLLCLDENGYYGALFNGLEYIYIPVFADVGGEQRAIAEAAIYYDSRDKEFRYTRWSITEPNESFLNKEHMRLYDKILFLTEKHGWDDCILVSDNVYHHAAPVLLTEKDGVYGVYDFNNIFYENNTSFEETWYSSEDYAVKRKAYIENNDPSGITLFRVILDFIKNSPSLWVVLLVPVAVIYAIVRTKKDKKKSEK